jgi:cyclic beta-1,2-glucan synthetase
MTKANDTSTTSGISSFFYKSRLTKLHRNVNYLTNSKRKLDSRKNTSTLILSKIILNGNIINNFYLYCNVRAKTHFEMNSSGKWVIENREVILGKFGDAAGNINKKFLSLLPKSKTRKYKDLPRIYGIVNEFLDKIESEEDLTEQLFVKHLQKKQEEIPLTLDEIFSIPIFFGYILTDRISDNLWNVLEDARARSEINLFLANYTEGEKIDIKDARKFISHYRGESEEFKAYFLRRLEHLVESNLELKDTYDLAKKIFDQKKYRTEKLLNTLHNHQISNGVKLLLVLKEFDWEIVFKNTSYVHKILTKDPTGTYPIMDNVSKSIYLDELKRVSKFSKVSELVLAQNILELARNGVKKYQQHVGYYLVDEGRAALQKVIGKKLMKSPVERLSPGLYMLEILIFVVTFYFWIFSSINLSLNESILLGILLLVPLYMLVKQVMDAVTSRLTEPRKMPKIGYEGNIPETSAIMYVIPSFLSSVNDINRLLSNIEAVHLGNRGNNIYFCLLLDYKDSDTKNVEGDNELFNTISQRIKNLNKKYSSDDKFSFFLRDRVWSEAQGKWMGWERKRGKLLEFMNALRKNKVSSPYYLSLKKTPDIKYLITVDEDTTATKDLIFELVGTLSHPLNSAEFDEHDRHLRGNVILQPRVDYSFSAKNQSLLSKQLCDARGYDFYSQYIHELNFDLFAEGHYTGKGIIEIDPFIRKLNNMFQNDTILSHDLLEGAITGTGYLSDIKIFEGFPSTVRSYMMRAHRWERGNWQIIDWIFPNIKDKTNRWRKNPLSLFQRFKVLDNMLSSLLNPMLFTLITLASFEILHEKRFVYVLFLLFFFLLNFMLGMYHIISKNLSHLSIYFIIIDLKYLFQGLLKKNLFDFLFLPYDVFLKVDAIIKAIVRRYITHKDTLEWATFVGSEGKKDSVFKAYAQIYFIPWLALVLLLVTNFIHGNHFLYQILLIVWLFVPLWIYLYDMKMNKVTDYKDNEFFLRSVALRTWHFFDEFTTAKTNHLPPDNIQGKNDFKPSQYTSITNIGFYMLSTFSAFDLGFITLSNLMYRMNATIKSLNVMERFRGHYYNWYDLTSLKPSRPWFISSVDSGNFLACILTLVEGLNHAVDSYNFNSKLFYGLRDISNEILKTKNLSPALITAFTNVREHTEIEVNNLQESYNLNAKIRTVLEKIPTWEVTDPTVLRQMQDLMKAYKSLTDEFESVYPNIAEKQVSAILNKQILKFIGNVNNSKNIKELSFHLSILEHALMSETLGEDVQLLEIVSSKKKYVNALLQKKEYLVTWLEAAAAEMDFSFLYNKKKGVISIGYKVRQKRVEPYHYGVLATEARLAVFLAISKDNMPKKSWTSLDRKVKKGKKGPFLMAWSGTVFEYFMPCIFTSYSLESVYQQTFDNFLYEEMTFAESHSIPWGFSESMYNELSPHGKYKYKAIGLAEAAQNPNVDKRLVVSPYSSFMAMPHTLEDTMKNLERISKDGGEGRFGFVEAIDYSKPAQPEVVHAYMAHHQGMIITSLTNVLSNGLMKKLFHSNKLVRSVSYLLEENKPGKVDVEAVNLKNLRYISYEY